MRDVREQRLRGVNPPIVVVAAWGWLTRVSLADNHSNDIKGGLTFPRPTRSNNDNMGGLTGVMPEQGYSDRVGDRSSNYFLLFSIREL